MAAPEKRSKSPGAKAAAARTQAMNAFIAHLKHPLKAEVSALRVLIKAASPKIHERVKWDAPTFYYKDDLATFDLNANKVVQLVILAMDDVIPADTGSLLQRGADGRRTIAIRGMSDVTALKAPIGKLMRELVSNIDNRPKPPADEPPAE